MDGIGFYTGILSSNEDHIPGLNDLTFPLTTHTCCIPFMDKVIIMCFNSIHDAQEKIPIHSESEEKKQKFNNSYRN
jgi:hypothetical protein